MRNVDLAAELGAATYVFWGGREGAESDAAKDLAPRSSATREAIDTVAGYVKSTRATTCASRIEPKPNEPRGDIFLPTVGHALAFIDRARAPDMVGVNPEVGPRADGQPQLRARPSRRRCGTRSCSTSTSTGSIGRTTRTSSSATAT